ncbi:hypothetical protein [Candidatus Villigracilis proximus]|uniref:hypothetical protein n=1 Tax=Candidatus Villigracilis proximus TaxID=3140683 RepID=UPI0031EF0140
MRSIEPLTESKMMPVWNGELYLEYHRGTYTSQARNKRANRKAEFLLHDTEFIAALASVTTNYQYPNSLFTEAWKTICLNQFRHHPWFEHWARLRRVTGAIRRTHNEYHTTSQ